MKTNTQHLRNIIIALASLGAILGLLSTQAVFAAGESYKFSSADNTRISVSGGDLTRATTIIIAGRLPSNNSILYGDGLLQHKDDCAINLRVAFNPDNPGVGAIAGSRPTNASIGNDETTTFACSDDIINSYRFGSVTIEPFDGTAPEPPTLAPENRIRVSVYGGADTFDKLDLKDSSGTVIDSVDIGPSDYLGMFHNFSDLPNGTYEVCSFLFDACQDATINNGLENISFGTNPSELRKGTIIGRITITEASSRTSTTSIAPFEMILSNETGEEIIDTQVIEAIETDNRFGQDRDDSGLARINNIFERSATFEEVPPGSYQVCYTHPALPGECRTVTKTAEAQAEVDFRIFGEDAGLVVETEELPSEKTCTAFVAGWILCIVADVLIGALDFIFGLFISVLEVEPLNRNQPGGEALFSIWNNVRILGNILFVLVFFAAIIGQTFSWLYSDYELKKMIPRLAIGAIAMQFSWYISGFLIDVFNVIGAGVGALVLAPVQGITSLNFDFGLIGEGLIASILLAGATSGVAALGTLTGLLGLLPPLFFILIMFVLLAFLILFLRTLLIYLLVIVSPLAFVAWVLPGTSDMAKQWGANFMRLLVMYPLIVMVIAFGDLAARIMVRSEEAGASDKIIGIAVFFAPYFLIPATFRIAGGILSNVSGGAGTLRKRMSSEIFGDRSDPDSYWGRWAQARQTSAGGYKYRALKKQAQEMDPMNKLRVARMKARSAQRAYDALPADATQEQREAAIKRLDSTKADLAKFGRTRGTRFVGQGMKTLGGVALARHGGVPLLNLARFGQLTAERYLSPRTDLDEKYSAWTNKAKGMIDMITNYGDDEMVFAMFGDYDPRNGKRLSPEAIAAARRYRSNQPVLNAALKYILKKQTNSADRQRINNYFAHYNPYGNAFDYQFVDDDGQLTSLSGVNGGGNHTIGGTFMGPKKGQRRKFEEFEMLKFGMWKGAGFGNQKVHRDLKVIQYALKRFDGSGNFGRINDGSLDGFLKESRNNLTGRDFINFSPDYFREIGASGDRLAQLLVNAELEPRWEADHLRRKQKSEGLKKDEKERLSAIEHLAPLPQKEFDMYEQAHDIGKVLEAAKKKNPLWSPSILIDPDELVKKDLLAKPSAGDKGKVQPKRIIADLQLLRADLIDRVNFGFIDLQGDDDQISQDRFNQEQRGTTWKIEDLAKEQESLAAQGEEPRLMQRAAQSIGLSFGDPRADLGVGNKAFEEAYALELREESEKRIKQIMSTSQISYIPESQEAIAETVAKLRWVNADPDSQEYKDALAKARDDLLNFTGIGA